MGIIINMKKLPNLPTGQSSFQRIRENRNIYVDKTAHIFRMIDTGEYYFLSRPRRFGKSLTISTLKCLFQGRRELFSGLWIAGNSDWEWEEYPVVMLDFNQISHDTPENMSISLERTMHKIAASYQVSSDAPLLKDQFTELILSLYEKTGMSVVVLIDEYDKPLIDHLGKGPESQEIAKANRDILKHFLGALKGGEVASVLRLVFITGVSRFSRVSLFSELNNLTDLTMHPDYADMLGYTEEELECCFIPHIEEFGRISGKRTEDIITWMKIHYDGYRFSERDVRVYNPFSVLRALDERRFRNYWFETGTPAFLINLLLEKKRNLPAIENMRATEALFSIYDIDRLQIEALLFQTGYITIKDISGALYIFDYPNREVKTSFLEHLLYACAPGGTRTSLYPLLADYLVKEDLPAFIETLRSIYSSIPYTLEIQRDEAYFHTLFYLMVSAAGIEARSEVLTCDGRIDLVMEFHTKLFIIEFKCNQSAATALQQIRDKNYPAPYRQRGKIINLLGINFDAASHNIKEWCHETL